jgi:hypothetical protein
MITKLEKRFLMMVVLAEGANDLKVIVVDNVGNSTTAVEFFK